MASIVFGDYKPREMPEIDFSDPNIIDIEWLDENKNSIGIKKINETDFNSIAYGQKVRVRVGLKNFTNGRLVFIRIDNNISKNTFKPKIPAMWVKDNEVLSEPFVLPVSLYRDEIEEYDYKNSYTKVTNLQELYVTVLNTTTFKKEKRHILKPYTYFRNYEELTGLFQENGNGKKTNDYKPDVNNPTDTVQNYEDKFIHYNAAIVAIVAAFIQFINDLPLDIATNQAAITAQVGLQARALWNAATSQVQGGQLDDRPLYWARNKMQVYLKRHPFFNLDINFGSSQVKRLTTLDTIIQLFEEKSRNYTGINFSKASVGSKKVLVTGFDPFFLNSLDHPYKEAFNILQSNPSGVVALALADNTALGANIQAMVVPVRYTDFDGSDQYDQGEGEGIIEKYIKPFITEVDMIITISQAGPTDYNIDKFATARRGGTIDNQNFTRKANSLALPTKEEWIETTLPKEFTNAPKVVYNWAFNKQNNVKNETPESGQQLSAGSGGNYLSNEIFYRVAKMRKRVRPTLYTGHFHINKIQDQDIQEDLKPNEILEVLNVVKKGVEEGIKGIKK
jgi:pyrrolidone-carboxylate peptidase